MPCCSCAGEVARNSRRTSSSTSSSAPVSSGSEPTSTAARPSRYRRVAVARGACDDVRSALGGAGNNRAISTATASSCLNCPGERCGTGWSSAWPERVVGVCSPLAGLTVPGTGSRRRVRETAQGRGAGQGPSGPACGRGSIWQSPATTRPLSIKPRPTRNNFSPARQQSPRTKLISRRSLTLSLGPRVR
jgi:hypothetical protein